MMIFSSSFRMLAIHLQFLVLSSVCNVLAYAIATSLSAQREPKVIYQNEFLLAIDKPAGLSFHSEFEPGTVQLTRNIFDGKDVYPVHRIDKTTSGVLIFAKDSSIATQLCDKFAKREVVKYYIGLSDRRPTKKMGTVTGDMAQGRRSGYKLLRSQKNPAITKFISFGVVGRYTKRSLRGFIFRPLTGRTHQLRVAAKVLGSPLLGDILYADSKGAKLEDRGYLHACAIRIPSLLDSNGELTKPVQIICPPTIGREWNIQYEDDHGDDSYSSSNNENDYVSSMGDENLHWFYKYFPLQLLEEQGEWFTDNSLLKSTI